MSGATSSAVIATALPELTTQFSQGSECAFIWDLTSASSNYQGTTTVVPILASDAADTRFASCQPSVWERGSNRFSFSPAVCPSSWTYYNMGSTVEFDNNGIPASTYSTAYCCASGHSLIRQNNFPIATMLPQRLRFYSVGETTIVGTLSHGSGSTHSFTHGTQVHQAWHISWASSDELPLSVPELTSSKWVPTWVPGETIPPGKYDLENDMVSQQSWNRLTWFAVIGVPLIFLTLVGLCVLYCIRYKRTKRRREMREQLMKERLVQQAMRQQQEQQNQEAEEGQQHDKTSK